MLIPLQFFHSGAPSSGDSPIKCKRAAGGLAAAVSKESGDEISHPPRAKVSDMRDVLCASPARWWRIPPIGFIRPVSLRWSIDRPAGPAGCTKWSMTVFGFLSAKLSERAKVWSRRGADFTDRFVGIAEAVRGLIADETLIDGEAIVLRDDWRSDLGVTDSSWCQS